MPRRFGALLAAAVVFLALPCCEEGRPKTDPSPAPPLASAAPEAPSAQATPAGEAAQATLRRFVERLASGDLEGAKALLLDRASCRSVMGASQRCEAVEEGQAEGLREIAPRVRGARVLAVELRDRRVLGEKEGARQPSELWVAQVRVQGPGRSRGRVRELACVETPSGLRVILGRRLVAGEARPRVTEGP
jgi:hypothetical protein